MSYPKDQIYLSKIVPQIQENILNNLFGSEYVNAKTLLQTTSQINSADSQDYEFEFRFVDENGHTSKQNWINFENDFDQSLVLQSYDDDIIYNYEPFIPLNNIHFRSYRKSGLYERKIMINMVVSRSESKNPLLPLNLRLSKETLMSPVKHLEKFINIQRRQRCSYGFKDVKLANWRVDKTIRFFTTNPQDMKLSIPLDINNFQELKYYDVLDIEFEYEGEFKDLYEDFFNLIEKIYKPFEKYNITYNIIKAFINREFKCNDNVLSLMPSPDILTNNVLKGLDFHKFSFSFKLMGEHVMVVVFGGANNDSSDDSISIYTISETSLKHIYGNLNILETTFNTQSQIVNRIKSFIINSQNDQLPEISVFEAEYSEKGGGVYALLDTLFYMSNNVEQQPLSIRQSYIMKFLSSRDPFISNHFVENYTFDEERTSWNYFINFVVGHGGCGGEACASTSQQSSEYEYITSLFKVDGIVCKSKDTPLLSSKIYKIKNKVSTTIDFKIQYNHIKKIFYLYVVGNVEQIIKSKSLSNKLSMEHFGYSLLSPTNTKGVYILYISPFMKNSFMFKPRLDWDTENFSEDEVERVNELMNEIYTNPLQFNGNVVKMAKANDGWVPLSLKTTPNTYLDSIKIGSLIYDNLEEPDDVVKSVENNNNLMNKSSCGTISAPIRRLMKSIYYILNQYIIEKYFNKERFNNVLDIFDEDDININLLYNVGLVNQVFAVNERKYVLNSYVEASINKEFNNSAFISGVKIRNSNNPLFDINLIHSSPLDGSRLINKLNKQYGYTPKSIDCIYFQRGLDEITSLIDIIKIRIMCENILAPNGKIVFKLFDGDKIEEFLSEGSGGAYDEQHDYGRNSTSTSKRNKRKIDKNLGMTLLTNNDANNDNNVSHLRQSLHETKDEYQIPNPESIFSIDSSLANDEYQYEYIEIDYHKQPRQSRMNITTSTSNANSSIQIRYRSDAITLHTPTIYSDINKLGLICYYYYKFNRFDENGNFKSEKIITTTQTLNLSHILKINTELFGNIYDRCLENWYSIYHNVDKLYGSKDYSQNVLYEQVEDGVLIEREYLNNDTINFIKGRKGIPHSTAIITKSKLEDTPQLTLPLHDEYKLYVIFPNFVSNGDIELLSNYIRKSFINEEEGVDELFRYYTHPKINDECYCKRLIFKKEFLSFIFESFKLYDVCSPMTQTEIATFLSANRKFSQIEYVENFFNTLSTFCVERV